MGRLVTRVDPLLRTESFTYDSEGNPIQQLDSKQRQITRQYDGRNRLKQVTYGDGASIGYTYDAMDRVTEITDSAFGTTTRAVDNLGRLTSESTPQGSLAYSYNSAWRRTAVSVAGQPTVTFSYDAADRLIGVAQGSLSVAISPDSLNRRTALTLPNGIVTEYEYDSASQLTEQAYRLGPNELGRLSYVYDDAGSRIQTGGVWARTGLPQSVSAASYNLANELTTWSDVSFTHDPIGNLASAGLTSYTWDARNRLVSITGDRSASFQYRPEGLRSSKTIVASSTSFLYDGVDVIGESPAGSPMTNRLLGPRIDETLASSSTSGTLIPLVDSLGSVVAATDGSGNVQAQWSYEPYGKATVTGTAASYAPQFTGRENDGTGSYCSPVPILQSRDRPVSHNRSDWVRERSESLHVRGQ